MNVGTMTSKGQITIPKAVRESLGLRPGSRVVFAPNEDGSYSIRATDTHSVMELAGSLEYDGPPLSIDQMDEAIAAGASEGNL
jgi:antitoxin PrlF